jgi:hypothetical protein
MRKRAGLPANADAIEVLVAERTMTILTRLCVATLAFLAVPALAQPGWRVEHRHRFAESAAAAERQAGPDVPAQAAEFRRYDYARRGRLSPEERRQLRRDIQDAGVGLYRRPPPLPPPPPPLAPPP